VPSKRKPVVMTRLLRPGERDDGSFDREFWQAAGSEAIFKAAAQMVAEVARFRGHDDPQPRLRRSVVRLIKRAR
jgi:hypothetical protein